MFSVVVETARCAVGAACSGATRCFGERVLDFIPHATKRAGTSQRDVPTTLQIRMRGEGGFSRVRGVPAGDIDWKLLLATSIAAQDRS